MNRLDATRIVVELAGDAPVVASLGHPAYDLFAAGDRPQNLYTWGSMGLASSIESKCATIGTACRSTTTPSISDPRRALWRAVWSRSCGCIRDCGAN